MYSGGTGTALDPYLIANAQDLKDIESNMSAYFKQTQDITLGTFQPIGYNEGSSTPIRFTGGYDGNNHSIQNGIVNYPSLSKVGIFRESQGIIENVFLKNVSVTGGSETGSILGVTLDINSGIFNIHTDSDCSVVGTSPTGGIVGHATRTSSTSSGLVFVKCSNKANVSGTRYVGGIVGQAYNASINDCYNTGNISGENPGTYIGGIAGYFQVYYNASGTQIKYCYNSGNITGANYMGGIVGRSYNIKQNIRNNYALNNNITRNSGLGTSIGRIQGAGPATLGDNYALDTMEFIILGGDNMAFPNENKTLTGKDGADITDEDAKKEESYTSNLWDFSTIWIIQETKYFPRFGWEPPVAEGSRFIIGLNVIPIHVISFNDNFNINFKEDKVNSMSTPSHLVFNGNQRRKVNLEIYTDYEAWGLLQEASEQYFLISAFVYNTNINLLENESFYISKMNTNLKKGDENNFYISLELTKSL